MFRGKQKLPSAKLPQVAPPRRRGSVAFGPFSVCAVFRLTERFLPAIKRMHCSFFGNEVRSDVDNAAWRSRILALLPVVSAGPADVAALQVDLKGL